MMRFLVNWGLQCVQVFLLNDAKGFASGLFN